MKRLQRLQRPHKMVFGIVCIALIIGSVYYTSQNQNQTIDNGTPETGENSKDMTSQQSMSPDSDRASDNDNANASDNAAQQPIPEGNAIYQNDVYGFKVALPAWWKDYQIIDAEWKADVFDEEGNRVEDQTVTGPKIIIRNPAYTAEVPTEDMPILILTHEQWLAMQEGGENGMETLHIGAAPMPPSLLAENDQYVFALPARYNFDYLKGYEEVDALLQGGAVEALQE
ncbi:MAG: hypothetical protein PWP38_1855 [Clostridiales bacterium]|nr:hypothetical protein [Clostridiales bacterium]